MPGTQVWSVVWEDSTCRRETKLMHHKYWSPHTLELCSATMEATTPKLESSLRSPQLEKARTEQRRPRAAKNKLTTKKSHLLYSFQQPLCWRVQPSTLLVPPAPGATWRAQQRQQHDARRWVRPLWVGTWRHAQKTPKPESADSPVAGGSGPGASRLWPGGLGLGGPGPVAVSTHSTTPCRRANQRWDQSRAQSAKEQGSEG